MVDFYIGPMAVIEFFDIIIPLANKKVRSNFRSVKLKNTHQYSDGHKTLVVTDLENKNLSSRADPSYGFVG